MKKFNIIFWIIAVIGNITISPFVFIYSLYGYSPLMKLYNDLPIDEGFNITLFGTQVSYGTFAILLMVLNMVFFNAGVVLVYFILRKLIKKKSGKKIKKKAKKHKNR